MKTEPKPINWVTVFTRVLIFIVMPLLCYQALNSESVQGDSKDTGSAKRLTKLAAQLSRATAHTSKAGTDALAAHVLSVHSRIPAAELLGRSEGLKSIAAAAMTAHITGRSLDDVQADLASAPRPVT